MKPSISRHLLSAAVLALPLTAPAVEFGTLQITQLSNTNGDLTTATPGISVANGPGWSGQGTFTSKANRGDYTMDFGNTSDTAKGVLISSIAQLTRNDSATGGPATGEFFATSSLAIDAAINKYWIAVHWAEADDSVEANYDTSYAFLPFNEFIGGVATNSVNNGEMTGLTGSPGVILGTQFTDLASPAGQYALNLEPAVTNASQHGILLVTGARNEDNFAMSRANADGTFTIFCHDSGTNGGGCENDGVGFSYLPTSAVGTKRLVAMGRVNGDASTDVAGGDFTVTKGTTGRWYLKIPGHTQATGTLIVSPEGGGSNNVDNIVAAGWDAANDRWIIESRDLTGVAPQTPGLQNMANAAEDAFSFAFFAVAEASEPPTAAVVSPANDAINIPTDAPLTVQTTDPDTSSLRVTYFGRRVGSADARDEFSVVALPDTQFYSENKGGNRAEIFSAQTDWIIAEKDARNIGFVLHLGDISQNGDNPATALEQWTNASNAMYRLETPATTGLPDGIPYVMAVGNHDQTPIGDADGTTTNFNTYFGVHPQTGANHFDGKAYYGGTSEVAKADNNFCLVSAGGMDFIVISLEFDTTPDAADITWADNLLKAYPTRRGIVITHHMVNTGNPASFSALGSALYEGLKSNPNLILMHGGHVAGEGRRTDTYQGRKIHSILADYQSRDNGGNGWLRIMKFRPLLNRVDVETYSPTLDRFETDEDSNFSLDVDLKSGLGPFAEIGTMTAAPGQASFVWPGLEEGTRYEWYATVSDGKTTVTTPVRSFVTDGILYPPTIELTSPVNGEYHASPANIVLTANAADIDGTVSKVEFFSGTTLIGSVTTAPYSFNWNNVPTGSYTVIAKATDNDSQVSAAIPVSVQVLTEAAAPNPGTVSAANFNGNWAVAATTPAPRQFNAPGNNVGDLVLKINGVSPSFLSGVIGATNWENPGNVGVTSNNNIAAPYSSTGGSSAVSVFDNSINNASDANPTTTEESAGVSVASLPYSGGWSGASVAADGTVLAKNLPTGVIVEKADVGLYTVSGLSVAGNLMAFVNGNGGTSGDNVLSVRNHNGIWYIDTRDNSGESQDGDFSFVYVPVATPVVLSGLVKSNGTLTALNTPLTTLGATVTRPTGAVEITFGNGATINPSNSVMLLCQDSTVSGNGSENIISYSANGNAFRIFSQDLPVLNGSFQATDFRFLVLPLGAEAAVPSAVSIQASDASAGEYGEDRDLAFTVSRSGPLTAALQIAYAAGGNATLGVDTSSLPNPLEIPVGQASATFHLSVLEDDLAEGSETLQIAIVAPNGYQIDGAATATAVIQDRPLQAFLHEKGLGAAAGDDDQDGVANVLEYYMGSVDAAERRTIQALKTEQGNFVVRFPHAKGATDVNARIEWSADFLNWHASGQSDGSRIATIATMTITPAEEDPEMLEATLEFSEGTAPEKVFLRLSVD